jgi:hypothetical protein
VGVRLEVAEQLPDRVVTVTRVEHDRYFREFYADGRWWVRQMDVEEYIAMMALNARRHQQ